MLIVQEVVFDLLLQMSMADYFEIKSFSILGNEYLIEMGYDVI